MKINKNGIKKGVESELKQAHMKKIYNLKKKPP
jgi:hypothetical protein